MATKKRKNTTNVSQKIRLASQVLADERFCDDDDDYVLRLIKAGLVTKENVYWTLYHFGYRWNMQHQLWLLDTPEWVHNCHRPAHANYRLRQSE